jgi:predicted nucleotidyltransferase
MGLADRIWGQSNKVVTSEFFRENLETLVQDASRLCPQCRVILFGSIAKNKAHQDSDIDIAIILPDTVDKAKFCKKFYKTRTRISRPADIFFKNDAEFLNMANPSPVVSEIQTSGVELFPHWSLNDKI